MSRGKSVQTGEGGASPDQWCEALKAPQRGVWHRCTDAPTHTLSNGRRVCWVHWQAARVPRRDPLLFVTHPHQMAMGDDERPKHLPVEPYALAGRPERRRATTSGIRWFDPPEGDS